VKLARLGLPSFRPQQYRNSKRSVVRPLSRTKGVFTASSNHYGIPKMADMTCLHVFALPAWKKAASQAAREKRHYW
jgi:hypothetical protein